MGKKRKKRKARERANRAYEAATSTPSRRSVVGANLSHDAAVERAYPKLTNWGRYLDENSDVVTGILDECVRGIVGRGIVTLPQPLGPDGEVDEVFAAELARRRAKWERRVDTTGELHYNAALRIIARSWIRDGEQFIRHVVGRRSGYPFQPGETPYRLELLESELCPFEMSADEEGWRQGIRRDEWLRRLEYAFHRQHPGDMHLGVMKWPQLSELRRVPGIQVTHLMAVNRWPATRGVSVLHSAIPTVYDLKDFRESERIKNRILASWTAAIQRAVDYPGQESGGDPRDPDNPDGKRYLSMAQGTIIDELVAGESIVGVGPDYPMANVPAYIDDELRRVAAATGSMHSAIARKFDNSYSAARQELVVQGGLYAIREDDLVAKVCRPIHERFVLAEIMAGHVELPRGMSIEDAANAQFLGPVVPAIDRLKDSQADAIDVAEGFTELEQVQVRRGTPQNVQGRAPGRPLRLVADDDPDAGDAAA